MTKILTGGVGKTEVAHTVSGLALDGLEITVSNDMDAAMKLRAGQADYYLGTCHTGAGASSASWSACSAGRSATPSAAMSPPRTRSPPCWRTARRSSVSPSTRSM